MTQATTPYAILLRGVNVGGITVRSAPLKAALLGIDGVENAKTVLASGNVMVETTLEPAALKSAAESALRDAFGYEAWVVVMSREHVAELVEACPYPADDDEVQSYVTLASQPAALDEVEAEAATLQPAVAHTRLASDALAWTAPAGGTTTSPLSTLLTRTRFKQTTTTRNIRTLARLLDIPVTGNDNRS